MEVKDITEGKILVATDLHGNLADYKQVKKRFSQLKSQGKADILLLNGDNIHGYDGYPDNSKEILDDMKDDKDPSIIKVLGNHEFAHIFHIDFFRGDGRKFLEPLEDKIESNREEYMQLLKSMAFAVRTKGGVMINHAGANLPMAGMFKGTVYEGKDEEGNPVRQVVKSAYAPIIKHTSALDYIKGWNHDERVQDMIDATRTMMEAELGYKLEPDFFKSFSPQVGQTFGSTVGHDYMWDVYFTHNEQEIGPQYSDVLTGFLNNMSADGFKQNFLVSGHISAPQGFEVIDDKQMRISTSLGANYGRKTMALVDAGKPYESIAELVKELVPLYE